MFIKRSLLSIVAVCIAVACMSWGTVGHYAVGLIAEHHLTPKAKTAVQDLLGNDGLAAISTWADDVRGEQEYKSTGPWHYINLPSGYDSLTFMEKVKDQQEDNVYKAVLKCQSDLRSPATSRKEKTEALKFLVHFIGDLHQPMHVSHAEDRGGNSIVVSYKGDKSNLHSVWDSKLLDDQGSDYKEVAEKMDTATATQIARWQNDALLQWLWESYKISGDLYKEIAAMDSMPDLKKPYYKGHINIVDLRIEMAGIRLAGILNTLFDDSYQAPAQGEITAPEAPKTISVTDVASHMNELVTVCAKIYGHKDLTGLTLVNLGAAYPNSPLTVVLKGEALETHKELDGREVCVTGKIIDYKGKPEIIVTDAKKVVFQGRR